MNSVEPLSRPACSKLAQQQLLFVPLVYEQLHRSRSGPALQQEPHTLRGSLQEDTPPQNILSRHKHTRILGFLFKKKTALNTLRAHSLAQFFHLSQIIPIPGVSSSLIAFICVCVKFQQQSDVLHPDVELNPQPLKGQTCKSFFLLPL